MTALRVDFVISRVLAITVPLGLLAWAFVQVTSTDARKAKRELENAGQLLNGEVLKIPVTEAIHNRMERNPNMVLIGNSFANTNVQVATLGYRAGMGRGNAVKLSIPNTIGTHWYALLKHQVFVEPYEPPDIVLIVSDLQSALLTEPLSEGSYRNLLSLIEGEDETITGRVERNTSYILETLLENRATMRRTAILTVRDASARRVLSNAPRKRVRKLTNDAMDQVFHASKTDLTLRNHAMPVTVGTEIAQIDLSDLPKAEDSFLPDIARLCHEHGARLVMVRNKESPLMPPGQGDIVPPALVRDVREAIGVWGGVLIDSEPIPMVAAQYDNLDHMNTEGSKRFTDALAEAVLDLGVADDREHYVRPEKPATRDVPDATPPEAIVGIRQSWVALGDGDRATWTWDEAWPGGPDTFRVRGVFEGSEGGVPPRLTAGGHEADMLQMASGRWLAQVTGPAPEGAWTVTVEAESAVVIEGLEVGTGSTPLYLTGYRPDVRGHRMELLGRIEVFDGVLYRDAVKPEFPDQVPELPKNLRMKRGPGPAAVFDAVKLGALSDMKTREITPLRARCSPLRVSEDGVPLPITGVGCREVREQGLGRMCHTERRVFFTATDSSHPMTNDREYLPFLDPERPCDGGFWVYPGDVTRLPVPADRLRELRDGVDAIEIDVGLAEVRTPPFGTTLRVLVDGKPRLTHTLTSLDLVDVLRIGIDPPIPPDAEVEIVVDNRVGETYAIVNRLALMPPSIVWEAFEPQPE